MIRLVSFVLLCSLTGMANAFSVDGPEGGGRDAIDHFLNSPRWAATQGSLLETGQPGFGGGLEYAFDDSFCDLTFVEEVSCDEIKAAFRDGLSRWSEGHPDITFAAVEGDIAEIRIIAAGPDEFLPFFSRAVHGYTITYARPEVSFAATNGQLISPAGGRIEKAEIRFNTALTYTLDAHADCSDCVHFPSLVLHEVGHVLGIGHPDELAKYNLDTDEIAGNVMMIDCESPTNGLFQTTSIDLSAVSIGQTAGDPADWTHGLSPDDEAARNALYPNCGITPLARQGRWGAFRLEPHGQATLTTGHNTEKEARASLKQACTQTDQCKNISVFQGCIAIGSTGLGDYLVGHGSAPANTRQDAKSRCRSEFGRDCIILKSACATD